jgi:cell wall-associated NlpC family hydrolase
VLNTSDIALAAGRTARVAASVAPMHREPKVSTPQTSQLLAGHIVQLHEQLGEWWRVSGADAYEGFMHRGYLGAPTGNEASWAVSLGCTVEQPDRTPLSLPLNARLAPDSRILSGNVVVAEDIATAFPPISTDIARSATDFFVGTSYQWGGVTPWGCDCSGLVQAVFALHGVQLPRDAWQQASFGAPLAVAALIDAEHALREADVLFFSDRDDRHVTHVGIVLPHFRMVHCALGRGGVAVENLGATDGYLQKLRSNFVQARRLL